MNKNYQILKNLVKNLYLLKIKKIIYYRIKIFHEILKKLYL